MTREVLPVEVPNVTPVEMSVSAVILRESSFDPSDTHPSNMSNPPERIVRVIENLREQSEAASISAVHGEPVSEPKAVDSFLNEAQRRTAATKAAEMLGGCAVSIFDFDYASERQTSTDGAEPETRYTVRLSGEYMRSQHEVRRALGDQATQRDYVRAYREYVAEPTKVDAPIEQGQEPEQADSFDSAAYQEQVAIGLGLQLQQVRPFFEKLLTSAEAGETLTRFSLGHIVGGDRRTGEELRAKLNAFTDENAAGDRIELLAERPNGALEVTGLEYVRNILLALPAETADIENEAEVAAPEPVTIESVEIPLDTALTPTAEPVSEAIVEPVAEPEQKVSQKTPKGRPRTKKPLELVQVSLGTARFKLAERRAPAISPEQALENARTGVSLRGLHLESDGDAQHVTRETKRGVTLIQRTADGRVSTIKTTRGQLVAVVRAALKQTP